MQFKKKVMYSGIFSAITLVTSLLIPIVPCRVAPLVPPYNYRWTLCSLNPDTIRGLSIQEFFGYTSSIKDSYFILILISFFAAMIFFHFFGGKKNG